MKKLFYKTDELRLLARTWEDEVMNDLTKYFMLKYNLSQERVLFSLIDYFVFLYPPQDKELLMIVSFIMNFKNSVFNLQSDDYTKDINIIKIPNDLDPEIINFLKRPLSHLGLRVRQLNKNELFTYFDQIYTDKDIISNDSYQLKI